jgi:hypothetical protein
LDGLLSHAGTQAALTALFTLAGAGVGWLYFSILRYSVARLSKGEVGTGAFIGLVAMRLVLFGGGAYAALVLQDWWYLIGYLAGFFAARFFILRGARKEEGLDGE